MKTLPEIIRLKKGLSCKRKEGRRGIPQSSALCVMCITPHSYDAFLLLETAFSLTLYPALCHELVHKVADGGFGSGSL